MTERFDVHRLFAGLLRRSLQSVRLPLTDEKVTQAEIARVLTANDIDHKREYRLSPQDVPDFFLPSGERGAVIEVKLNHARPADVLRQLERYAAHDRVTAIFLVSNKAMPLPVAINGKPVYFVSMGRAWL